MTVLALIPNRQRCGVSDYTNHLYSDAQCLGSDVRLKKLDLSFWNCLKAPFVGADVVHLQHEYSLFGFAGCWGFLLLVYLLALRLTGGKLAVTLHTVYDWERTNELFAHRTQSRVLLRVLRLYGKAYHRLFVAAASLLIFLSDVSRAAFANTTPAAKAALMVTIPSGVYDVPIRTQTGRLLEERYGLSEADFVLTLFGFAFPNKGYHLAIEALHLLHRERPELKLLVVSGEPAEGGGRYLEQLKQLVSGYGLGDSVVFTGFIRFDDPLFDAVLVRTNCFLYPYVRESATSGSLATTLSARKTYLTSDLAMFRDFAPGIKFRAGDVTDLAAKIEQVRQMSSPDLARYRQQLESYIANNNLPAMRKRHVERFLNLAA